MTQAIPSIWVVEGVEFPMNAVTQKFAFIGKSESGKTYAAGRFTEQLLACGVQTVIVDTIGNWWGLRLLADGKGKGFSIPVIGGEHGDIPIEFTGGKVVAEFIVQTKASCILDISEFNGAETTRFITDFATALLQLKKKQKSPLMVVWEECQDYIPQNPMPGDRVMLGAMEKLIKKGRNFGLGVTLISQRPQAVNKQVLNQTECMLCFQLTAPHDRKAMEGWMRDNSVEDGLSELPKLQKGECFIWSPGWLKIFRRGRVLRKKTFDTSATPEFGKNIEARDLAPIELENLSGKMKEAVEKVKDNSPVVLKKKIADLEYQGKEKDKTIASLEKNIATLKANPQILQKPLTPKEAHVNVPAMVADINKAIQKHYKGGGLTINVKALENVSAEKVREVLSQPGQIVYRSKNDGDSNLGKCERAILTVLAQHQSKGSLDKSAVAVLSTYSVTSSGFMNSISSLRTRGYIVGPSERLSVTDSGITGLGSYEPLPTGSALHEYWYNKLGKCEQAILRILVDRHPNVLDKDAISDLTGYSLTSSGFNNSLSKLRTMQLIEGYGPIKAAPSLFS